MPKTTPKKAVIVLGGELIIGSWIKDVFKSSDIIVAADKGISHCLTLNVTPNICIGDFDSVSNKDLNTARKLGWEIKMFPEEKEKTDGQLAIEEAINLGAETINIVAGLYGNSRYDHRIGNILLLTSKLLASKDVRLIEKNVEISLVNSNETCMLDNCKNATLSLIPLSDTVKGIKTDGLKYNLFFENLNIGETRGISNIVLDNHAEITVSNGMLLMIIEKEV
ncbi:MAG: thiamine diphosphokinase [SAR202 cluster bacterium]|nr:thiamine diphosphokinase [SAR202 cluster bacterium]|tara:strand:- start:8226 stop:8894 length:669 start_codon:yes stop_codon:yes gene_type:complete